MANIIHEKELRKVRMLLDDWHAGEINLGAHDLEFLAEAEPKLRKGKGLTEEELKTLEAIEGKP